MPLATPTGSDQNRPVATVAELLGRPCVEPALIFLSGHAGGSLADTPDRPFSTRPVPTVDGLSMAHLLREKLELQVDTRVEWVRKSQRNAFRGMITVGRTATNDLVVDAPTVSKVHCAFTNDAGRWTLTDSGSSNGTFLDGARLPAHERRTLLDGVEVGFGEVRTVFVLAETLGALLAPLSARDRTP